MKKQFSYFAIALLMSVSLAIPAAFARSNDSKCDYWGTGVQVKQMYDPDTVETISGKVIDIENTNSTGRMSGGVHLLVRTQTGEEITVRLGPAWYVDSQEVKIQLNDMIEVKGSRMVFNGQTTLIAAEVKKGDRRLTLRDEDGIPVWSGRNRQRW